MENMSTPTALIFSRQNVNDLPAGTNYKEGVAHGAYAVIQEENPRCNSDCFSDLKLAHLQKLLLC